jgi:GNAT superfamily N-acetyltransferase
MDLECEVATRDGTRMRSRPIRPEDSAELSRFHGFLSPSSVYRRYFYVHPELSRKEIDHLTTVDYVDRLALVVEHAGQLVAVGRYERYPGTTDAEVAFVVADAYQHRGLGTLLLGQLAAAARRTGISRLRATVLVENRAMVDVFTSSGFPMATTSESGVISVRLSIEPGERSSVASAVGTESPDPL